MGRRLYEFIIGWNRNILLTVIVQFPDCLSAQPAYTTDTIRIHSEILGENRTMVCFIPENFTATDSVTLLCMPDGENSQWLYDQLAGNCSQRAIIGIGIINTNRRRDLLPVFGAGEFLSFIEQELLPDLENRFIITEKILFGHSFGGATVLYCVLQKPALFNTYIVSSPKPTGNFESAGLYESADARLLTPVFLYIAYGTKDHATVKKGCKRLEHNLSEADLKRICWKMEILPGANHNTTDLPGLLNGIGYSNDIMPRLHSGN
jgi:enterochelin esterase-like enzyme